MSKVYRNVLSVITIMLLLTITIGTSYAYYMVNTAQVDENTLITSCFSFTLAEEGNSIIDMDNATPMTEVQAITTLTPYTFSVTNSCTTSTAKPLNYSVTLNTLEDSDESMNEYMMYKLNTAYPNQVLGSTTNLVDAQIDEEMSTKKGIAQSYALGSGTLKPGETKTYNLYLWIDKNASSEVMGDSFLSKVMVYAYL